MHINTALVKGKLYKGTPFNYLSGSVDGKQKVGELNVKYRISKFLGPIG